MKKLFLLIMFISVCSGCNRKVKPDVYHVYLEPWQLAYVPYKLHDTISFTNQNNSSVLHFKCTKLEKYMVADGDTTECPATYEYCDVAVTEQIRAQLTCLENNTYNFKIYISTSARSLFIDSKVNYYSFPLYDKAYMCGSCHMDNDTLNTGCSEWRCYTSKDINGYTYTNVGLDQIIGKISSSSPIDTFGYLFYNQQSGILGFYDKSTGIWNKNHL
jgi:hypothetical protein